MSATVSIRADILRDDTAVALGMTVRSPSPILTLCRKLIEAGHDSALPLRAYRGPMLCLAIRAIGEAAALQINSSGTGFAPYCAPSPRPPIRGNGVPATGAAALAGTRP